ncbi:flagellar basal body-associated FliL family protein [Breoghania sp. JC706]|uniref:flagellar basal body-associated FliL family protein n=1 Tax=Breoghania sp. JC706 TaxID=3117732 RepID=UPI00300A003F
MFKALAIGIWMAAVTAGSSYGAVYWMTHLQGTDPAAAVLEGLDYEKTRPINVPVIEDGRLQGYVVAQFVFTADAAALARVPVPPHPFIVDEAFRLIYEDRSLDFNHLERYDLENLKEQIRERVNARMKGPFIREVLVEEFNYFSKDDVISR